MRVSSAAMTTAPRIAWVGTIAPAITRLPIRHTAGVVGLEDVLVASNLMRVAERIAGDEIPPPARA